MSKKNTINDMDKDRLMKIIGDVDERYIEEAAPMYDINMTKRKKTKVSNYHKWVGIAASVALMLGTGVVLWQSGIFKSEHSNDNMVLNDTRWPQKIVYVGENETTVVETIIELKWDEKTISEQFAEFKFESQKYSTMVCAVEADYIGDKLGEVTLEGYDIYEEKKYITQAEVHEIAGINTECATALRFEGRTDYYVYVNSWYRPATLGEFIEALNLTENITFGKVYYSYFDDNETYHTVEFEDIEDSVIWEMLLDEGDISNVHEDTHLHNTYMSVSVDIPLLGFNNISLSVTTDGYIVTNILNTGKCFYIGEEKVQAFVEYVMENLEGYEYVYIYNTEAGEAVENEEVQLGSEE